MSIQIEKLVKNNEDCIEHYSGHGLVKFKKKLATDLEQSVLHDPVDGNHAHGNVIGEKPQSVRRKFAKKCEWVILPS
jgi:hypothetical protein